MIDRPALIQRLQQPKLYVDVAAVAISTIGCCLSLSSNNIAKNVGYASLLSGVVILSSNHFAANVYASTAANTLESELRRSRSAVEAKQEELTQAQSLIDQLKARLGEWETFWNGRKQAIQAWRSQVEQEHKEKLELVNTSFDNQLQVLMDELNRVAEMAAELPSLQEELENAHQEIQTLTNGQTILKTFSDQEIQLRKKLAQELEALTTQYAEALAQKLEAESQLDAAQAEIQSLSLERDNALSQAESKRLNEISALLAHISPTLENAIEDWKDVMVQGLASSSRKLTKTLEERPDLEKPLEKLQQRLAKLKGETDEIANRYSRQISDVGVTGSSPKSETSRPVLPLPLTHAVEQFTTNLEEDVWGNPSEAPEASAIAPKPAYNLLQLSHTLFGILYNAASEFAALKGRIRNTLNLIEAIKYQTEIADLKSLLEQYQTADVIPKSQHLAILNEFKTQKDQALGILVAQAEDLEQDLKQDTDQYVQTLIKQLETSTQEIEVLKQRIADLSKPQTFAPATRDDLRMANVVIAYFEKLGVILDRAYSDYRKWEADLFFHTDRNPRIILVSDLNEHSERLHPLLNCLNEPQFKFDATQGLMELRVQISRKPKADASEIHKLWKRADHFESIVQKWERVRVTGGSGAGKSPTAENLAVCILKQRLNSAVKLANPMDDSKKNYWTIPATWTSHKESVAAIKEAEDRVDRRSQGAERRDQFILYIIDEIDTTMSDNPAICKSVKAIIKQASHQNIGAVLAGQNANTRNYQGFDRSDWNNAVNLHIGSNAYEAIENSNQFTSKEKNELKNKTDQLKEFCEDQNRQAGLDPDHDPDAYRFAFVVEPNKKPYFVELPAFGQYTYDQVAAARATAQTQSEQQPIPTLELAGNMPGNSNGMVGIGVPTSNLSNGHKIDPAALSTIPGKFQENDYVGVCPDCGKKSSERKGRPEPNKVRLFCRNPECDRKTFTVNIYSDSHN